MAGLKRLADLAGLALLLAGSAPAQPVASGEVVSVHGLCFRSPLPLSAPREVGLDALLVAHPPGADARSERFSLTAVRFPPEVTDTKAGMSPAELRSYVATVFLAGQAGEGAPVQRRLLGQQVDGVTFTTPIPAPSTAEVYALRLRSGTSVVLGFKFATAWRSEAERLISAIATSLRECD